MRNRFGWLCLVVTVVTVLAQAQQPTFAFGTSNQSVCPSASTQVGSITLVNNGATAATIQAGTAFSFLFDAPVAGLPTYTGAGSPPTITASGNTVRLAFGSSVTVAGGGSIKLDGTRLDLTGRADGTLIGVEGSGFVATSGNNVGNVATSSPIIPSPASLSFTVATNSSNSAAQNVALSGRGAQTPFKVTASTVSGGNWLTVTPPAGPGTTVNVTATATGLQTQTYTGAVAIADALSNPCVTVPVSLAVVTPSLSVSASSLSFTAVSTDTFVSVQQFTIGANTGTLNWTAVTATSSGGNWLTINPAQGDRKSTRLNSSHIQKSRMPSSA